jgi:dimethylargininase
MLQETSRTSRKWGAQSAVAPLRRALLCPPNWTADCAARADLAYWGYTTHPDLGKATSELDALAEVLAGAGVSVELHITAQDGVYDAVFACDWGVVVDDGAIVLNAGKPARRREADIAEAAFREFGVPVLHRMRSPATAEGGDLLWLNPSLLLVGRTYRTNAEGLAELRSLLASRGVTVVSSPVPHFRGQASVMHLLSLISLVDRDLAVVYLPLLAVETVELPRSRPAPLPGGGRQPPGAPGTREKTGQGRGVPRRRIGPEHGRRADLPGASGATGLRRTSVPGPGGSARRSFRGRYGHGEVADERLAGRLPTLSPRTAKAQRTAPPDVEGGRCMQPRHVTADPANPRHAVSTFISRAL